MHPLSASEVFRHIQWNATTARCWYGKNAGNMHRLYAATAQRTSEELSAQMDNGEPAWHRVTGTRHVTPLEGFPAHHGVTGVSVGVRVRRANEFSAEWKKKRRVVKDLWVSFAARDPRPLQYLRIGRIICLVCVTRCCGVDCLNRRANQTKFRTGILLRLPSLREAWQYALHLSAVLQTAYIPWLRMARAHTSWIRAHFPDLRRNRTLALHSLSFTRILGNNEYFATPDPNTSPLAWRPRSWRTTQTQTKAVMIGCTNKRPHSAPAAFKNVAWRNINLVPLFL